MAYTTVPTKANGNTVTGAEWNTYIRDNYAAGIPDLMTTKGDIVAATAADAASRLAIGADGTALFADSTTTTGLTWGGGGPKARYVNDADQVIGNASTTIIRYDTVDYDSDTAVTTGAAWKFTIPTGGNGYYLVIASCYLEPSANWGVNESASIILYKNNVLAYYLDIIHAQAAGTFSIGLCGHAFITLVATDYIDIRLSQNSGDNVTIETSGTLNHVAIARLF